jgi:hypothetical protein
MASLKPDYANRISKKVAYVQSRNVISLVYGGVTGSYLQAQRSQHIFSQSPAGFGSDTQIQQIFEIHTETMADVDQVRLALAFLRDELKVAFGDKYASVGVSVDRNIHTGGVYSLYILFQ